MVPICSEDTRIIEAYQGAPAAFGVAGLPAGPPPSILGSGMPDPYDGAGVPGKAGIPGAWGAIFCLVPLRA